MYFFLQEDDNITFVSFLCGVVPQEDTPKYSSIKFSPQMVVYVNIGDISKYLWSQIFNPLKILEKGSKFIHRRFELKDSRRH